MKYIWIVWDIAALLIIGGCIGFAARRGFVRTLVSFFSYIIAAVAANILSAPISEWLYENLAGDFVKGALTGSLRETLAKNGGVREFAGNAPAWLRGTFELLPEEGLGALDISQNAARAVDVFVESSLRDPIIWVLSGLCFLVLFSVFTFLVRQIAMLFTFVDRIPLIGTLNTVLGGVLGAVQAVIVLIAIAILAHMVVTLSNGALSWISPRVFEDSFLMRFFYRLTSF